MFNVPLSLVLPLARVLARWLSPLERPRVRAAAWCGFAFFVYTWAAAALVGVPVRSTQLFIEAPAVSIVFALGYWALRPGPCPAVLASLPLLELYLLHDAYYAVFGRVMRVVDFRLLGPLAEVMDGTHLAILLLAMSVPVGLFAWRLHWRRWLRPAIWAAGVTLLVTVPLWAPSAPLAIVGKLGPSVVPFSDLRNVENHGRLTMLLHLESQRQALLPRLAAERHRTAVSQKHDAFVARSTPLKSAPNIHLVMLESFIDPTFFGALELPRDPAHPRYRALVGPAPRLVRSPVFGGKTAQAEFEVLCGVRAHERYAPAEFLTMSGAPTPCLPRLMGRLGYRAVASNAFRPNYFNATHAYESVGFDEVHFPRAYAPGRSSYLRLTEDPSWYLFDGELLRQNLAYVSALDGPVFNYVLGVYGHSPFDLEGRAPLFQHLPGDPEPSILRLVNQFHHRSRAVVDLVDGAHRRDPEALVIVTSDHLPPLPSGTGGYRALGYLDGHRAPLRHNVLLVFHRGRVVDLPILDHWMLPALILDVVTGGRFCDDSPCPHRHPQGPHPDDRDAYTEIIAKGSR